MSDIQARLLLPFIPDASFSLGTLEVEEGGETNEPAQLDYSPDDDPNSSLVASLAVVRKGSAHFRIRYSGTGPLSFTTDPLLHDSVQFVNKGARTEQIRVVLTFDGDTEKELPGSGTPQQIHTSTFFDQDGNTVSPPRFRAHPRAFVHTQPVFGAMLVEVEEPFILLQAQYVVPGGTIPEGGYPPIPIQVLAPGRVAQITMRRRATINRISFHNPPRKQHKVEIKRYGVVDRIFPTPPASKEPPPPDPVTGRDDYTDVERITSIHYTVVEEDIYGKVVIHRDAFGNVVNGLRYIQENLNTQPPENSYVVESFVRPQTTQES